MVEFITLPTGLSASERVAVSVAVSPHAGIALEGNSPAFVVTVPVAGVWKGAIVVWKVCDPSTSRAVVDVEAADRLRVVAIGDEQRPPAKRSAPVSTGRRRPVCRAPPATAGDVRKAR
jgi:hypothetical protein